MPHLQQPPSKPLRLRATKSFTRSLKRWDLLRHGAVRSKEGASLAGRVLLRITMNIEGKRQRMTVTACTSWRSSSILAPPAAWTPFAGAPQQLHTACTAQPQGSSIGSFSIWNPHHIHWADPTSPWRQRAKIDNASQGTCLVKSLQQREREPLEQVRT